MPGMVRVSGTAILNLSKVLPTDDPLAVRLDGDRLFIGSFSLPCHWANVEPNPIQIPMDVPLTVLLGLKFRYSDVEIIQSGLSDKVGEALGERKKLVRWATNKLAPLGITFNDIEELADRAVKRADKM